MGLRSPQFEKEGDFCLLKAVSYTLSEVCNVNTQPFYGHFGPLFAENIRSGDPVLCFRGGQVVNRA